MAMTNQSQKTIRKVQGRITRHKNVRYHNDAALFHDSVKTCLVCKKSFENRKRWASRSSFAYVKYCSRRCRRNARSLGISEASK
jgi:hypothetical protein